MVTHFVNYYITQNRGDKRNLHITAAEGRLNLYGNGVCVGRRDREIDVFMWLQEETTNHCHTKLLRASEHRFQYFILHNTHYQTVYKPTSYSLLFFYSWFRVK